MAKEETMTDAEKILAKCDDIRKLALEFEVTPGCKTYLNTLAGHCLRTLKVIEVLAKDCERLIEALSIFKEIGDMGPEDTVMTFVEDPSVIEYAAQALAQSAQTTREIIGGEDE